MTTKLDLGDDEDYDEYDESHTFNEEEVAFLRNEASLYDRNSEDVGDRILAKLAALLPPEEDFLTS